jgi:uncharacterized phage-associated protein
MIRSIMNPKVFLDLVESARQLLTDKEYKTITAKVQQVITQSDQYHIDAYECRRLFSVARGAENGYSPISLERVKAVMLTILQECGEVFCTKMNKLLFYIDFLSYRQRGIAMTGLSFRAIDFGPVPDRWDKLYSQFDEIHQELRPIGEYEGNVLLSNVEPNEAILNDSEKEVIHIVCSHFRNYSSGKISAISHEEPAWIKYHESHSRIPFTEAFELKAV